MKGSQNYRSMTQVVAPLLILLRAMMFVASLRRFEQLHRPRIVLQMRQCVKNSLFSNQYHQPVDASVSSILSVISTTRRYCVSSKVGVSDMVTVNNNAVTALEKANAGIRLIKEDNHILVLWKTSNVALSAGESLIRPASIPVNNWINIYLPTLRPRAVYPQLLTSSTSGLVLIAKTEEGKDFFRFASEGNRITVTYEAVLFEKKDVSSGTDIGGDIGDQNGVHLESINHRLERLRQSLGATIKSNQNHGRKVVKSANHEMNDNSDDNGGINVTLLSSTNSGTYVRLHSIAIQIQVPRSDVSSLIIPDVIAECLESSELSCVKEGKTPYIALINIEIKGVQGIEGIQEIKGTTEMSQLSGGLAKEGIESGPKGGSKGDFKGDENSTSFSVSEKAPSKFMKLMRREEILFGRMRESSTSSLSTTSLDNDASNYSNIAGADNNNSSQNNGITPQSVETVTFMGLRIMVPHSALRPRDSSGVLVRLAVDEINDIQNNRNNKNKKGINTDDNINDNVSVSTMLNDDYNHNSNEVKKINESTITNKKINKNNKNGNNEKQGGRAIRMLDLGCGSGALLLSTISCILNATPLNVNILGVGVDLDLSALNYARINADYAGISSHCAFIAGDFGQLHTEGVRSRLTEAVLKCESNTKNSQDNKEGKEKVESKKIGMDGKGINGGEKIDASSDRRTEKGRLGGKKDDIAIGGNKVEEEGLFDIILCNPPFLSSKATAGRVTSEGDGCLVGGVTGMEPYVAICKSVTLGCNENIISSGVGGVRNTGKKRSLLSRIKGIKEIKGKSEREEEGEGSDIIPIVEEETDRSSFLSALPLLSPHGVIIFQVPGGDRGWSDVTRAVEGLGLGFGVTAVRDERGVKRCVVLRRK